ncbi:hypothetical protein BAC1_01277 [uncultured bacterium]|jgi:hypothetical protein|nr:hypothetical protein BAC1_01277 [uncultured bacterium]
MDSRCKFLTKIKHENGNETWTCYHEFERGLLQACFLPKGGCRYNTGPFKPKPEELKEALEKAAAGK